MEFFSESTGLYLFSALLQANAAILAILGVFGIFRIQSLQSKIEYIKQGLLQPRGKTNRIGMTPIEIHSFGEFTINEKKKKLSTYDGSYQPLLEYWINAEELAVPLKPIIIKSTASLGLSILIFTLSLIFSNLIHKICILECVVFFMILIYEIFLILKIIKNVKKLLDFEIRKKTKINNTSKITKQGDNK